MFPISNIVLQIVLLEKNVHKQTSLKPGGLQKELIPDLHDCQIENSDKSQRSGCAVQHKHLATSRRTKEYRVRAVSLVCNAV